MDLITALTAAGGASAGGAGGYQISRSLRFNSADSAHATRTFASVGDRKTWTWSAWVKLGAVTGDNTLFSANASASAISFVTYSSALRFVVDGTYGGTRHLRRTTAIYRDPSAWYHIVVALDTTQATDTNRIKAYINGEQVALDVAEVGTWPAQNSEGSINNNIEHCLGERIFTDDYKYNGYMTEVHFVDGQALTPSSFGEINATTGVWSPIEYTGTYGTNGFYLDFSDNTSTTTLGYDAAGSNDWTLNNFSVTAGAGNDSLVDTPTPYGTDTGAGGEVRGNYATMNPLVSGTALSNGNLNSKYTGSGSYKNSISTMSFSSGKWYAEVTVTIDSGYPGWGIVDIGNASAQNPSNTNYIGFISNEYSYFPTFGFYTNGSIVQNDTATFSSGDVVGVAIDLDSAQNTFKIYQNGSLVETLNINGPPNAYAFTDSFVTNYSATTAAIWNFGQRPFAHTAPSGYKALVTTNLPDPTVLQGDDYFNTVLWTGTDVSAGRSITGVGFAPDFVWSKPRSLAYQHNWYDAVRGVGKRLQSNATDAESTNVVSGYISSFDSDGFTTTAGATDNSNFNDTGDTYVAWNWNAGGSNATNTDGTITSTVRANPTAGFSIVSYTGTGSAATVGHGLGVAPSMIIVKNRDQADAWQVYHAANTANPETDYLVLNTTAATADAADRWNDTAPTTSVFSIGNGVEVNTNTEDYIAYVFAAISGFSAFGKYTGNGSADGPFVYTDFRPALIIYKRTDSTGDWFIWDSKRTPYNGANARLFPNSSAAEDAVYNPDYLSNGFKLRSTGAANPAANASGGTYIYAAFAENPFKYSLAR